MSIFSLGRFHIKVTTEAVTTANLTRLVFMLANFPTEFSSDHIITVSMVGTVVGRNLLLAKAKRFRSFG